MDEHGREALVAEASQALALPGRITWTSLQLPPDLPYEEWLVVLMKLRVVYNAHQWWIGDALAHGESRYGDRFSQGADQGIGKREGEDPLEGLQPKTIQNYTAVARSVPVSRRRDDLNYSIHAEIAGQPPEKQEFWLQQAAENHWSVRQLRVAIRSMAAPGEVDETLERRCDQCRLTPSELRDALMAE